MLTVSTMASLAAKWLLPRIGSFQDQHKDIDVRITTSLDLVDFRRDEIDAAIRYGRGQWSRTARRLAGWRTRTVSGACSPALLESKHPLHKPEDLANQTLLHTSGGFSDDWRVWLTAARGCHRRDCRPMA